MEIAGVPLVLWLAFCGLILVFLGLDLGVFHRTAHKVSMKEALIWTGVWISLALAFNAGIFLFWERIQPGSSISSDEAGMAFLAGYLVEYSLSVDNIFVFLVVFRYFALPEAFRHRILFWGIIGALIFRAIFIAIGAALLERFTWMMLLFGAFLIFTGVKMVLIRERKLEPERNPVVRLFRRFIPVTQTYVAQKFFTRIDGRLWATPLLIVLLVIEMTDLVFAVDSIPAIFAITSDPFLVFTSNVFAILGLRSLFFALSGLMERLHLLSYGLAAILVFVGAKMLYGYGEKFVVPEWPKFSVGLSLAIIATILAVTVAASLIFQRRLVPRTDS
ncbi:MAG: TerC family protein [Armatimonadetes bacterium]|nr:TerC family protein [Armatimonadota bacterium]NOG93285.1 TerC family protein [Armatimonadota bacterium]